MNLEIYVTPRIRTEGLCGSFDRNSSNDIYHKDTKQMSDAIIDRLINSTVAASWRLDHAILSIFSIYFYSTVSLVPLIFTVDVWRCIT